MLLFLFAVRLGKLRFIVSNAVFVVVGEVGNARCGDIMKIYLKISNGIIEDVKFKTFGWYTPTRSTRKFPLRPKAKADFRPRCPRS